MESTQSTDEALQPILPPPLLPLPPAQAAPKSGLSTDISAEMERRLRRAAERDDLCTVVKILKTRLANPNGQDETGATALSLACRVGSVAVARALLDAGADPCLADHMRVTPLHLAAKRENLELVKLLLMTSSSRGEAKGRSKTIEIVGAQNRADLKPVDLTGWGSECRRVLREASRGVQQEGTVPQDEPIVPKRATQWAVEQSKKEAKKKDKKKNKKKETSSASGRTKMKRNNK